MWRESRLRPRHVEGCVLFLEYADGDSHSRMPQIEQEISTIDIVDVAIVVVRPSVRPRVYDFKVISAVGKMGPASDDFHVTDGEMMIVPEVSAEVGVIDTACVLVMPGFFVSRFLVVFFLPGIVMIVALLVSMLILGESGKRSSEEQPRADTDCDCESFHSDLKLEFFPKLFSEALRRAAPAPDLHYFR